MVINGQEVKYTLGERQSYKGSPMEISLPIALCKYEGYSVSLYLHLIETFFILYFYLCVCGRLTLILKMTCS